jgi:hypothetical protein
MSEARVPDHTHVPENTVEHEESPDTASPPQPPGDQVHDWLNQRILALNQEGQSRWNKLLGMILGN